MRFEVPQFIEIEDKIIGPLTWKQFVYLAGGVGVLVILYFSLPFIFFVALGFPFGALAASLAFHRVNNRPFSAFLEALLSYAGKGKLYLWRKSQVQSIVEKEESLGGATSASPALSFTNKKSIAALSRKLDLQPNHDHHG